MHKIDYIVESYSELQEAVQKVVSKHTESLILFRGQRSLYDTVRAGRGRPSYSPSPLVESGWAAFASTLLGVSSDTEQNGIVQAILQHYGYETFFVDLTTKLEVAAWFASNDFVSQPNLYIGNQFRKTKTASYTQPESGEGFIIIMAFKDPAPLMQSKRLIDLSCLPVSFERPLRQSGWLILDRPPTRPVPDDFVIGVIKIKLNQFNVPFTLQLFPEANADPGYAKMRELPFVQFDSYSDDKTKDKSSFGDPFQCAVRILDLPEYNIEDERKWNDITIYEPLPVREWCIWHADLNMLYPGAKGDIAKTKKITISPTARKILEDSSEATLLWPDLGSDGFFFSFAALDHDKLIDHSPPYEGVWLQRSGTLIIETPTSSDDKELSVGKGHAYFLSGQSLERQEMAGSCQCNNPESHDRRVTSLLRLQTLVSKGKLILLPHPYLGEDRFFVITGTEREFMAAEISKCQVTHRLILDSLRGKLSQKL